MTPAKRDQLDQQIDEVLASFAAEEPRRVSAASVRQTLEAKRASRWPVWLAAAAILILAVGVVVIIRATAERAPGVIARSEAAPVQARATAAVEPQPIVAMSAAPSRPRRDRRTEISEAPYEGLSRLVVASIEIPEPLSTASLSRDSIQIPGIEITPLLVSSLPNEHEPKQ